MDRSPSVEYRALAQFRFLIRSYLVNSENAARAVGLEPQQYMVLLAVRGLPADHKATIGTLAERLKIRPHSVVELVNRMEKQGLCRRERSKRDRRHVIVRVTSQGERLLSRLVGQRIEELRLSTRELTRALHMVLSEHRLPARQRSRAYEQQTAKRRRGIPSSWVALGAPPDKHGEGENT